MPGVPAIETVADDRHPETGFRCRVHPQLMCAPGVRTEHYAASSLRDAQEFVVCHRFFAPYAVHTLAWTVKSVGREGQVNASFPGNAVRIIVAFKIRHISLFHSTRGEKRLHDFIG